MRTYRVQVAAVEDGDNAIACYTKDAKDVQTIIELFTDNGYRVTVEQIFEEVAWP